MARKLGWLVAVVAAAAAVHAGAPEEAAVQGLYQGTWEADGKGKLEARVVALGKREYQVFAIQHLAGGKTAKVELKGKTEGEKVSFEGKAGDVAWQGSYADGAIRGQVGDLGKFDLARTDPKSPMEGKKPPEGAVVLLDGKNFDKLVRGRGPWYLGPMEQEGWGVWEVPIRTIAKQPTTWPSKDNLVPEGWELAKDRRRVDQVVGIGEDGSIRVPGSGMNSKVEFDGSFDAHVEFFCPFRPADRSQGRGNSGVYLPCGEEIQVLDSFGMTTYKGGGCGGLYAWKDPDAFDTFSLASVPPLTWQTYDIEYRVKQDAKGKPLGKPRVTLFHNGIKIHDNVELKRDHRKGRFHFQDHGNPVRYRNIWVLPIAAK